VPLFAAIGGMLLGASSAAAAGAGVTALVGGLATAAIVAGVGSSIYGAVSSSAAVRRAANASGISGLGSPATTVDAGSSAGADNLGRAALISTSPQGVQGVDPTLRYRLLGNSTGLGNG
jgi:hypothetical protein